MKFAKRVCYSCCALIWAALVFASLLTRGRVRQVIHHQHATANPTYDPLGSEMFVSSGFEEIWDQHVQCFDKSTVSLTLAFDVGRNGLTNQHIALLHGFAVAFLLGAETIVEPRLWIGLKEISLQQLYDGAQISKALKQLNIAFLPEPPNNVETVALELQNNMGGEPLRAICSRARNVLRRKSKPKGFLLHLGLAAGLLRVEESNLGLISFLDKHLEYNQGIQMATQNILNKLPTAFNGLHLSPETYKTLPKEVVPKLMEAGFGFDTTLFVASEVPLEGFETGAWLPYHMVTILNFSEETTMDGMDGTDGHMEFWDFLGPMNQLILQKAINFTGFSLSNHSCAIAQHRWRSRGSCDKAYDSGTYFDGPSTPMFLWRGDWPWWPSCEKDVGGASQAIPKRIVSQSCRLIFFAGVEGTGHHFWHSLLPHLHPFTTWSENFSAQLYDNYHKVGFFSTWDESVRSNHSIRIKQLMADADRSIREQGGGILPLNVLSEGTSGMMSYPNLFGVDRALQYPNVHALAKLAEDAGVDLRIVLLVRHPGSIVRSGLKRHFEKTQMHAIKMYTLALALLSAQLSLLDPSFFACWRYEAPTVGISDLLQFMGSREDPDDFKQVVAKESRQGANEIGATPAALQTATALHNAMLSKYCNASLADDNVSSQKLPKRIVSQSCRFPFFAGIEGTGHHFWHSLLPYLHPFTNWSGNLSAELYSGDHKTVFFSTWDESVRSNHSIRIKQVMADADRSIREQGGGIVPLNVLNERVSGMMSYPNFLGRTRALQNPDVPALAKLAEDAGVDLRIVLLLRHPRSVVRSGMRRGYEKSGLIHAISMYTATLSLLSTHLSLLDPSFIACWRYEAPNVGISDLLSFMGSQEDPGDFKQIIAKYYRGGKKHASSGEKLADEALQTATALHNALIAKYCKPRSAHARP